MHQTLIFGQDVHSRPQSPSFLGHVVGKRWVGFKLSWVALGMRMTRCREIKRCEESERTWKNPFASGLAELNTTLKLLTITDQWYIVPVKSRFGRNWDFLALLLLPLAGGPKDGKHFYADWRLISSANFHTSSDNCERNTQKWNSNNRDCKKESIETLMWLRRSCGSKLCEAKCFATTSLETFNWTFLRLTKSNK